MNAEENEKESFGSAQYDPRFLGTPSSSLAEQQSAAANSANQRQSLMQQMQQLVEASNQLRHSGNSRAPGSVAHNIASTSPITTTSPSLSIPATTTTTTTTTSATAAGS